MHNPKPKTKRHNSYYNSQYTLPSSFSIISPHLDNDNPTPKDTNSDEEITPMEENGQRESRIGIKDWIMVFSTLIIAVATSFYTYVALGQWDVMSRTIEQNRESYDATISNFYLDQRAWVGPAGISPAPYTVEGKRTYAKEGRLLEFGINIINTGKTPAKNFRNYADVQILKHGEKPTLNKEKVTTTIAGPSILFPRGVHIVRPQVFNKPMTKPDIDSIANGRSFVFVIGYITYEDIFKNSHWTSYCFTLRPSLTSLAVCNMYNEFDN